MTFNIFSASAADIPRASATLAKSFEFYPWTRWSIPADGYMERLERLQAIYLSHALEHGLVLVSDKLDAVGALLPASCPDPEPHLQEEIANLLGDRLSVALGAELPPRPEDSWDLATLGVVPSSAGKGLGSAIITEFITHVSSSAHPRISLETSAERNVRLYERHGFSVSSRTALQDGPVVYSMSAKLA